MVIAPRAEAQTQGASLPGPRARARPTVCHFMAVLHAGQDPGLDTLERLIMHRLLTENMKSVC